MKNTILAIFLTTALFTFGHASEKNITTQYGMLKEAYKKGSPVLFKNIKGFYSGRCYAFDNPNTPFNSALGYYEKTFDPMKKTNATNKTYVSIISFYNEKGTALPADVYDSYSSTVGINIIRSTIKRLADTNEIDAINTIKCNTLCWNSDISGDKKSDYQFTAIKNRNILIIASEQKEQRDFYSNTTGKWYSDSPAGYDTFCYYDLNKKLSK